jgi:hypothetical protein
MLLNATMCMKYEVIPDTMSAVTSPMECMMGGVIFSSQHPIIDHNGVQWSTDGRILCESDPPDINAVHNWVEAEKARLARTEPQIK